MNGSQRSTNAVVDELVNKLADMADEEGEETKDGDETEETEDGDETEELAADHSMVKFSDLLVDKLVDKLFDVGLSAPAGDQLDEDEVQEDSPLDEVQDDKLFDVGLSAPAGDQLDEGE